jgi:hypothetical protein
MRLQVAGRGQPKAAGADIILHQYDIVTLDRRAAELHTAEKNALKDIEDHLATMSFYIDTLSDKARFKGIGPTMAGVLLSEFDINRADTPSKFWAYAGLAPKAALRCKHCNRTLEPSDVGTFIHSKGKIWKTKKDPEGEVTSEVYTCPLGENAVIERKDTYESGKSARPERGVKLPYNSFLRSKLVGVLGPVLLKCDSPWRVHYDNHKNKLISQKKGVNDAHRHQASIRYMIKMLIAEIWGLWREHEKLPRRPLYSEEKLGHVHSGGGTPQDPRPTEVKEEHQDEIDEELKLLKSA